MACGALSFGQNRDRVSPLTEAQFHKPLVSFRINRQLMEWTGRAQAEARLRFRITVSAEKDIP
jgi:hypothetical protein